MSFQMDHMSPDNQRPRYVDQEADDTEEVHDSRVLRTVRSLKR